MANHKTISLDESSRIIAERIPNFSRWVRDQLREWARSAGNPIKPEDARHIAPPPARVWGMNKDKCNPRHRKGMCNICWEDA